MSLNESARELSTAQGQGGHLVQVTANNVESMNLGFKSKLMSCLYEQSIHTYVQNQSENSTETPQDIAA